MVTLSDERLNEMVEEKVFGRQVRFDGHDYVPDTNFGAVAICRNCEDMYFDWEEPTEECNRCIPYYGTSPSDDYLVLKHVRENWQYPATDKFNEYLHRTWDDRRKSEVHPYHGHMHFEYEPGDYSRAALAALGVDVNAQEVEA